MTDLILENLRKKILDLKREVVMEEIGKVVKAQDGIATVYNLEGIKMEEIVLIDDSVYGITLNLDEEFADILLLSNFEKVKEGSVVKKTNKILEIPVSEKLIGRVINPLIQPLDGLGEIFNKEDAPQFMPLQRNAATVIEREPVQTPLFTGIAAIDSLIPIGRGQRELVIGDRGTGKTQLCLDAIYAQKFEDPKTRPICIYVSIGQKTIKTRRVVESLKNLGCFEYSIVINTCSSDPAALVWLAPYTGMAIGEYFLAKGGEVLIVLDDLTKHAWAYRQISLLLKRPPGREAYPGDVFYLHSKLLERSVKLGKNLGGGSITCLPIIETQLGDISSYIPTNVISITDGQIFLETDLFNKGIRPAINIGLSVSRVGSKAQFKGIKKVAGSLKLDLANFRELEKFLQFGQELDAETQGKIERGKRLIEILKQAEFDISQPEDQIITFIVATAGTLDDMPTENTKRFIKEFLIEIKTKHNVIYEEIKKSKDFTDNHKYAILRAADAFKQVFT